MCGTVILGPDAKDLPQSFSLRRLLPGFLPDSRARAPRTHSESEATRVAPRRISLWILQVRTMTEAAARKKQRSEPTETTGKGSVCANGLWVDESRLPTTIAKRGPKHSSLITLPPEIRTQSRVLGLADIVLGNPKGIPGIERRKKDRALKIVARRSIR